MTKLNARLQFATVLIGALLVAAELAGGIVLLALADEPTTRSIGGGLVGSAGTLIGTFFASKPRTDS